MVTWANRTDFGDDQDLGLAGNLLNIEDGTGVDLGSLSVNGQITGSLNNLAIETNAVTDVELADNAVAHRGRPGQRRGRAADDERRRPGAGRPAPRAPCRARRASRRRRPR